MVLLFTWLLKYFKEISKFSRVFDFFNIPGYQNFFSPQKFVLNSYRYNAKADLWSVGTVLFEMIAGCPPFTGDNHIHLLRNIQTKSVRLPEGVKISQECINVLRHLLHKNPMRRAGFQAFFESADAFVALGCNGQSKKIDSNTTSNSVNFETRRLRSMSTVQESVSSNESSTASVDDEVLQSNSGSNSGPDQNDLRNVQKAPTKYNNSSSNLSGRAQSATKTTVTPPTPPVPINLVQANAMGMNQPTMIPNNSHSQQQQQQKHQLVNSSRKQYYNFTPLTNSPPSINAPITLKMYDSPRNTLSPQSSNLLPGGTSQGSMPQHFLIPNLQRQGNSSLPKRLVKPQHQESNFTNSRNFKATSSQGSESDSEFVMVEHSNTASSIISQNESGYQSVHHSGLQSRGYSNMVHSPSTTPNSPLSPVEERNSNSMKESGILINSQRRSSIQGHTVRRKSAFLSTSPPAGATLISIMTALQNGSTQAPIIKDHTISQCISRLQSIPNGQLRSVKDLELAVRVLATAEDIGRRAVNVAHLGDTRAYHGMRLSLSSSFSSSAQLIEGIEKANPEDQECNSYDRQRKHSTSSNDMSTATTVMSNHRDSTMEEDDDIDDDEMPFAISSDTIEDLPSIGSRAVIPMNTKSNSIHHNKSQSEGLTPPSQKLSYLRGALSCYLKALSFMKYAVKSIQFVMDKVGTEGIDQSNSSKILFANRCQTSLKWLTGQFTGVIERADASSIEVKKLETFLSSQSSNSNISDKQNLGTSMSVQEIVYNHALVYGRDGAVRELLGQHEAARAFYRSAGILAEVLLMESNLGEDDQKTLNDFVDGFWDRMRELDTIVSRKSQSLPLSPSRRGSRSGESVVGLVGGIPNQLQQRRQHNIYG